MEFKQEHYDKLSPISHIWESLKKDGTILQLIPNEIQRVSDVLWDIHGIRVDRSCQTCIGEAVRKVFIQYDKFKAHETIPGKREVENRKERRPRIQFENGSKGRLSK